MAVSRICSIPDCGKPVDARGWCGAHWSRWRRHGDPLGGRTSRGEVLRYYNEVVLPYDGDECRTWPYTRMPNGYGQLQYRGHLELVHRVLCEAVNGPPPTPKHDAAHSCGRGRQGCVTKRHLSWKTRAGNEEDKILHGTSNRGERCGAAKLTEADVRDIRSLAGKELLRETGERFGISMSHVSEIIRRKTWAWLP